jgi:hypothetical protein
MSWAVIWGECFFIRFRERVERARLPATPLSKGSEILVFICSINKLAPPTEPQANSSVPRNPIRSKVHKFGIPICSDTIALT